MPRPPGPDPRKIEKIVEVLRKHPDGLWMMEIARLTGIPKSTVHRYIQSYLSDVVEEVRNYSGLIRTYRLKKTIR